MFIPGAYWRNLGHLHMQSIHTPEQEGTLHSFSIIHLYTEVLKGQSPTPGAKDTRAGKMDPIHALQLLV